MLLMFKFLYKMHESYMVMLQENRNQCLRQSSKSKNSAYNVKKKTEKNNFLTHSKSILSCILLTNSVTLKFIQGYLAIPRWHWLQGLTQGNIKWQGWVNLAKLEMTAQDERHPSRDTAAASVGHLTGLPLASRDETAKGNDSDTESWTVTKTEH